MSPPPRHRHAPALALRAGLAMWLALCALPGRSFAQGTSGCLWNSDCPKGQECQRLMCVPDAAMSKASEASEASEALDGSPATPPPPRDDRAADAQCGRDRRCRIARLKERQQAQRQAARQRDQAQVEAARLAQEAARRKSLRRYARPWGLAMEAGHLGTGLTVGYQLLPRLRLEFASLWREEDIWAENPDGGDARWTFFSAWHDTGYAGPQASVILRDGWWSPWLALGALYGAGSVHQNRWDYPGEGEPAPPSQTLKSEMHLLRAMAGLDLYWPVNVESGLHFRLGAQYVHPLYLQLRYAPGLYDELARAGFEAALKEQSFLGVTVLMGGSF